MKAVLIKLFQSFFILIFLMPVGAAVYFNYDRTSTIVAGTFGDALIVGCDAKRQRNGSNFSTNWAPIAEIRDGTQITGGFYTKGKDDCESQVGETIKVIVHPTDPSKHRQFTFWQFFFWPLITTVTGIFIIVKTCRYYRKDKR